MDKFSLLKSLNESETSEYATTNKPKLTSNIVYEEYEVSLFGGKSTVVYIPKRNTEVFEDALSEVNILTEYEVRSIMRKFNGVTEI